MEESTPRRCTATNRAGEQCRRSPILGGTVCIMHGGAIPNVKAAAQRRLLAMVEPVLGAFEEILDAWHRTRCETCGHPTGDTAPVIQVGRLVLDRTGFHPTLTIQQQQPPAVPVYFDWLSYDQRDQIASWLAEAKRAMQTGAPRALPPYINAVLVEDKYADAVPIEQEEDPDAKG